MRKTTFQDYKARMLRVLVFIQQNLDRDLSIEELAGVAHFSPYHFHRIFRGMIGETLGDHIRRIRIERAAQRLKTGAGSILEVALEAGYESHEAFTRAFRSVIGVTPSGFRAGDREASRTAVPTGVHFAETTELDRFDPIETGDDKMKVEIVGKGPLRLAFVRHLGPYDQCGAAWETLMSRIGSEGWIGADTTTIGICHDDPDITPQDKIRYDACVTVPDHFQPTGEIGVMTIPRRIYAMTTHQGPYTHLGRTYSRLCGEWLPRSGRTLQPAPCLEIYLNDPESTEAEELLTDIYMALEPTEEEE